jgi:hypothetical protein
MQRTTHIEVAISYLATHFRSQDELQGLGIKEIHVLGGKVIQLCRVESVKTYRNVTRQRSAFYFTSLQSQPPSRPMRPLPHFSHQALLPAVTPMAGFEIRDESEYTDEADAWSRCMAVR